VPASVTGDGLILGTEVGAAIRKLNNNLAMILVFRVTDPDGRTRVIQTGIVELFSPHTMVVNKSGRRFADETFFQGMVPALRDFDIRTHTFKNLPCFLIFDQQFADKFAFGMKPAGTPIPDTVARSFTLVGLASSLGIDGAEFERTVERYNRFVDAGKDDDFHRGENKWRLVKLNEPTANPTLGAIEKPPFYGVKLGYSIASSAGLLANEDGQVLHVRKHPIPGLYASGVAAARTESGAGYQAGMNLASGMTFSYRAVQHMKNAIRQA
jgi:3-oxosteroid 1-dehydrogenase